MLANAFGSANYLPESHLTLVGGVFSQAMESVTPDAMSAHAFSVAVRSAWASVEAPAVRHAGRPWKDTQTSQRYRRFPIVVYTKTINTVTANPMASRTVLFTP